MHGIFDCSYILFHCCFILCFQKQVFLPPDRRLEEMEEKQMEMERAFEDMYTQHMSELHMYRKSQILTLSLLVICIG
jgi:hypothetical protein